MRKLQTNAKVVVCVFLISICFLSWQPIRAQERVEVPRLVGLKLSEAKQMIREVGLRVGTVELMKSDESPGTVIRQDPIAGVEVRAGARINLVAAAPSHPVPRPVQVHQPQAQIAVPSVVGENLESAMGALQNSHLEITLTEELDSSHEPGTILRQYPDPGTELPASTPVRLVIARPEESTTLDHVDNALEEMVVGNIAFNVPDSLMYLDQSLTIQLLLDPTRTVEELMNMISEEGVVDAAEIKISGMMEARLTGDGFQIEAITPEQQFVSGSEPTEWKWDIRATEVGDQQLHLTLSAIISVQGERGARAIRTFDKVLTVRVSFGKKLADFAGKNWQWLLTVLIIPVIGWLVRRRRKSQKTGRA